MNVIPRKKEIFTNNIVPSVLKKFNFTSCMQVPVVEKIVLNMGLGAIFNDGAKMKLAQDALSYIAGSRAVLTVAKKSNSSFKIRTGMKIGAMVTLRGNKMYEFIDRLQHMVLTRIRDFRGFNEKSINGKALTFGIKDCLIFPEVRELMKTMTDSFGLSVTFVSSQNNPKAFKEVLLELGFPFIA